MAQTTFKGVAASSGRVTGEALIIKNPMIAPDAPEGDFIVVAEYTTPVLNLLFMNAKGVVCETGGMTMHAAVIARELGIPCVVGTKGIMKSISDKQTITIDGLKGEVYVEQQ
jgi:phosphohistidine swiveling domain-containing protein